MRAFEQRFIHNAAALTAISILLSGCLMGEEQAAWARLSPDEREAELERIHATSNSPDDLALWPPELDGGPLATRSK